MADEATPPAEGESLTPTIDMAAITKTVTEQVTEALSKRLSEIESNLGTVAGTLAKAPPASPDEVAKLVRAELDSASKIAEEASAAKAARDAKIAEIVKSRLGGHAEFASLITADDDAGIETQVAAVEAAAKKLKPDFGTPAAAGVAKDTNASATAPSHLTPGQAAYAQSIKLN